MQFPSVFFAGIVLFYFGTFGFAQDVPLLDHGGAVQSVAFSPADNAVVASAGGHNTIKLWNVREDTVKTLTGHTDTVNSVAFSPGGRLLVSGSADGTIKIWDVSQWQNIGTRAPLTIQMPFPIHTVVFHPNGQLVATSGGHVKVLDISSQAEIARLQHKGWVWTLAISHDGRYLAADEGEGTTVKVWDLQRHRIATLLEGHTADINAVKFSPDNRILASSSWNGEVKLWEVSNWKLRGSLRQNGDGCYRFLC